MNKLLSVAYSSRISGHLIFHLNNCPLNVNQSNCLQNNVAVQNNLHISIRTYIYIYIYIYIRCIVKLKSFTDENNSHPVNTSLYRGTAQ